MKYSEAVETMCRRCQNHEACQGTGCEPKKVLLGRDKQILDLFLTEHLHEEYESELDAVGVGVMISRVADIITE